MKAWKISVAAYKLQTFHFRKTQSLRCSARRTKWDCEEEDGQSGSWFVVALPLLSSLTSPRPLTLLNWPIRRWPCNTCPSLNVSADCSSQRTSWSTDRRGLLLPLNVCVCVSSWCLRHWRCGSSRGSCTAAPPCGCAGVSAGFLSGWSSWSRSCSGAASPPCVCAGDAAGLQTVRRICSTTHRRRVSFSAPGGGGDCWPGQTPHHSGGSDGRAPGWNPLLLLLL